jgi:hypothetical protein
MAGRDGVVVFMPFFYLSKRKAKEKDTRGKLPASQPCQAKNPNGLKPNIRQHIFYQAVKLTIGFF